MWFVREARNFSTNLRWMQFWHIWRPLHHLRLSGCVLIISCLLPMWKFSSGISDAYYCAECTRLEKDRDGCPKIVNLGASRTDLFYERRRLGVHICILSHHKKLTTWRHRLQEGVVMLSAICKAAVALLYMIHVFSLKIHQYIVVIHHIFKDKLDREWQVQLPQDFPDLQRSYGWMLRFNKMHVWSITHLKCCMSTFGGVIREI